jgi:hypothetical protein
MAPIVPRSSDETKSAQESAHPRQTEETRRSGEGRIRTGDTTIFSRVLYQLSYLAWARVEMLALGEG